MRTRDTATHRGLVMEALDLARRTRCSGRGAAGGASPERTAGAAAWARDTRAWRDRMDSTYVARASVPRHRRCPIHTLVATRSPLGSWARTKHTFSPVTTAWLSRSSDAKPHGTIVDDPNSSTRRLHNESQEIPDRTFDTQAVSPVVAHLPRGHACNDTQSGLGYYLPQG